MLLGRNRRPPNRQCSCGLSGSDSPVLWPVAGHRLNRRWAQAGSLATTCGVRSSCRIQQ
jgi:hypothetical protein